jgi:ubiquinol-cytochrome c reductase cytochrome c subunit
MNKTTIALLGALALLGLGATGASAQQAAPQAQNGGDAAHGKKLFMTVGCYQCHGTVGQGGPGVRLAPNPLPVATIITYIRNPTGEMPPYVSKVLSDKDVVDIHAYLASIKPPPKLADIPELH